MPALSQRRMVSRRRRRNICSLPATSSASSIGTGRAVKEQVAGLLLTGPSGRRCRPVSADRNSWSRSRSPRLLWSTRWWEVQSKNACLHHWGA